MSAHDKYSTRVQVEVNGYTWRCHGVKKAGQWECHLVELISPLPLDGPVTKPIRDRILTELAKALGLDESAIAPITADLILA